MPIFEYKCRKAGHIFEVLQLPSEEPLTKCQVCESPVEKLVSSAAFHLKGSGWYTTDYKKDAQGSKEQGLKTSAGTKKEVSTSTGSAKPEGSAKEGGVDKSPCENCECKR